MKLWKTSLGAAAVALASLGNASAQEIPCETATLIVPWAPGGGTHIIFSIFEETINKMDGPNVQVVTISGQGRWLHFVRHSPIRHRQLLGGPR